MSLQTLKEQKGFTIVELLIVIVVIGILAAISIVAYTGVTRRANQSAATGNAASVQKAAESYNASADSGYPTLAQLQAGNSTVRVPAGVTIQAAPPDSTTGKTTIGYKEVGTTGACIAYWDFNNSVVAYVYAGDAKTGGVASSLVTCANT